MNENEATIEEAISLLDRLLGVEVRRPGTAAALPAVIRVIELLEPAGGKAFPVFPASYAGEGQNAPPVYDLNGIEYGPELEVVRGKDRDRHRHHIARARQCTIDSPQSQANRTEVAFLEDEELQSLVPQASVNIPRADGKKKEENILCLPHRVADFRMRTSDKRDDVKAAISDFANGDALKLLRLMPTSIVFGFWDSRGEGSQPKHARILLSRIDAFDVVPCTRHAVYSGPYSKDEFADVVLANRELAAAGQDETESETEETKSAAAKKAFKKMAERGFTAAPSTGLGGVLIQGSIERLALISLTDIGRLWCRDKDSETTRKLTNAARRYVFALAALAEGHPRAAGSHRLRSGCELVGMADPVVDLRGGDSKYGDAAALKSLYVNRDTLVGVAADAKKTLGIPPNTGPFEVTRELLRADFGATNALGPAGPAPAPAGADEADGPKRSRRASQKTR
ncbi:MAG: type I-U CRISPR-associated RAMP protein Csb1/Cas7u [Bryobacteraceae bacterium]|jgi:CRISPR-associated protein Csb1